MTKITKIACFLIVCFSVLTKAQEPVQGYTIDGYLDGLQEGTTLYLIQKKNSKNDTLSVTKSRGGRFNFKGHVPLEGQAYFISLDTLNSAYKHLKRKLILVHMENKPISIRGTIDSMEPYDIEITGSKAHSDLMDYANENKRRFIDANNDRQDELSMLAESKDSSAAALARIDELSRAIESASFDFHAYRMAWVESHLNSLIAPFLILRMDDSLKSVFYPKLTGSVQQSFYGVKLKHHIDRGKLLSIGQKAPELNLMTADGKFLSLHTVAQKHKLTLIDFWASWCTPCRKRFPELKELYSKYKNKGFAIYGVSIDKNEEAWLKALKKDNLPWYNVIDDYSAPDSGAEALYGTNRVPFYLLIDQEGRILLNWIGNEKNAEFEVIVSRL